MKVIKKMWKIISYPTVKFLTWLASDLPKGKK